MKIALTGDVMLGRLVDQCVVQNRSVRPEALRSDVLPLLLSADCRLINLECAKWHPITKAFHFRALPRALEGSILYSTGDFVDDYMVDKDERNNLSFLFMLEVEKN